MLTKAAPVVVRHLTVDISNRDAHLSSLDLVAKAYSRDGVLQLETTGVAVSVSADPGDGFVSASRTYSLPGVSLVEACRATCKRGVTVLVRYVDPSSLADDAQVATNLEVSLHARAEGTGPVDIDLLISNDDDRAFQGMPAEIVARTTGTVHVGHDSPTFETQFEIVIDGAALEEPYGYPLLGQILVWHSNKTAVGHPNAHSTGLEFDSPARPENALEYGWVSVGTAWLDEPPPAPAAIDLLPLCTAGEDCRIRATLQSMYEGYLNDPEEFGEVAIEGRIEFEWYVEVHLQAFDGRSLPEGAIRFDGLE